ncbi:diguanylate cyclase, putative [Babesia ovis]|uniref:Diguanylate cyclase, putative n=1 Tax=Babesia ovis TaxID=5869 RepID=A0A9W5T7Q9_BABOV|nr:diguanylate cyclase, putative [Babesia ovis]
MHATEARLMPTNAGTWPAESVFSVSVSISPKSSLGTAAVALIAARAAAAASVSFFKSPVRLASRGPASPVASVLVLSIRSPLFLEIGSPSDKGVPVAVTIGPGISKPVGSCNDPFGKVLVTLPSALVAEDKSLAWAKSALFSSSCFLILTSLAPSSNSSETLPTLVPSRVFKTLGITVLYIVMINLPPSCPPFKMYSPVVASIPFSLDGATSLSSSSVDSSALESFDGVSSLLSPNVSTILSSSSIDSSSE